MQLTGRRVPDPILSNVKTVADLHEALKVKQKPKKLAQSKELQQVGIEVPNVKVHERRQTVVHKEKRVGRWKVIEAELEARDLPVLGNRWPHYFFSIYHKQLSLESTYLPSPQLRAFEVSRISQTASTSLLSAPAQPSRNDMVSGSRLKAVRHHH